MRSSVKPLRKYGQNFLKNRYYAEKIVSALNIHPGDVVVEIGAGTGVITGVLQHYRCRKIVCLEIDDRCIPVLQEKFGDKVEITQASILDYSVADLSSALENKIKIIGNIPYHITSPILFKLLDDRKYITQLVIMVQQEVAERLLAVPHSREYGIPTVLFGFYAQIVRLFKISRQNFFPVPKVDSTVLLFNFRERNHDIPDHNLFTQVVRQCFQMRRKIIQNNLRKFLKEEWVKKIKSVPLTVRAEDLSVADYVKLTNEIYSLIC
jgi:16S rRNA (adenine1518-N6/adenine1519-N6)-dimethyltransferase